MHGTLAAMAYATMTRSAHHGFQRKNSGTKASAVPVTVFFFYYNRPATHGDGAGEAAGVGRLDSGAGPGLSIHPALPKNGYTE